MRSSLDDIQPPTIAIDARKLNDYGIGTYIRNLVEQFATLEAPFRFLLIVAGDGFAVELPTDRFRQVRNLSPGYSLRELASIPRLLRREGVNLFHAPHYVLPPWLPCPAVTTVHDVIHLLFPQFLAHPWLGRIYARAMIGGALRRSAGVLTVSQHTQRDLEKRFTLPPHRVRVIHNGVDARFFERGDPEKDRALRSAAGIGADRPYLLVVGNPKPHKNVPRAVEAAALVRRGAGEGFDFDLVLAGATEGDAVDDARATALRVGFENRLQITGKVSGATLGALYRGARCLLHPSLYEGFGLPILEAMASGLPVVASDAGSIPEIAGDAAVLVDPLDVAAMAQAVVPLMTTDSPARKARIAAGRERAAGFSWERAARETLDAYGQALRPNDPRRGARPTPGDGDERGQSRVDSRVSTPGT